ncbi:DUF4189 domain-containing protein [Mycobacterium parmense]|uniref:Uncharacterized protein n=1 Tax=Mycobacterium parmense TaxID=185642 RepID=A0A7I7YTW1_9MYCO|nr:DUF4189 domain-containing protein [Mycobacterium parmense]MCV7351833.1 DUF4189 domain-containing protein [Mycobacterium parmense]ORW56760.1 hypothetical protein AWC20_02705 [Mycobacterium parmense]BBZ44697.1 hypothetical protein MPRM_19780 [Mycobacterium parmense]
MYKRVAAPIAVGLALAGAPISHADSNWIAMAISDSTGHIQTVDGAASQDAAQQVVMSACRKTISDCRLLASGPGGCIALATNASNTKYFGGWGATMGDAEAAVLAKAPGGTIVKDHGHCLGDPTG